MAVVFPFPRPIPDVVRSLIHAFLHPMDLAAIDQAGRELNEYFAVHLLRRLDLHIDHLEVEIERLRKNRLVALRGRSLVYGNENGRAPI